jgi:uncharacterized protein (DUF1697 family)
MTRHVAFLRAINVGGHAIVKMEELKRAFVAAGCKNVATVIQSGNVVFEAPDVKLETLARRIGAKLESLVGHEPGLVMRSARELDAAVRGAPFLDLDGRHDVKLYVVFLAEKPKKKRSFPIASTKEALSLVASTGREVYVVSRRKQNGFYGFPNGVVESELGVSATSRSWSTVSRIADLMRSDA